MAGIQGPVRRSTAGTGLRVGAADADQPVDVSVGVTAGETAIKTDLIGWPVLVPGPVFLAFEMRGPPPIKGRHRSRLVVPKTAWVNGSYITRQTVKMVFIQQYPDPATEAAEKVLAEAAGLFMRGRAPTEQPVALLVHAFRAIPASYSKTDRAKALAGALLPTPRPDADNHLKVVKDALNGICWRDDSQVCDARVIKRYSDIPAIRVEIREFLPANAV